MIPSAAFMLALRGGAGCQRQEEAEQPDLTVVEVGHRAGSSTAFARRHPRLRAPPAASRIGSGGYDVGIETWGGRGRPIKQYVPDATKNDSHQGTSHQAALIYVSFCLLLKSETSLQVFRKVSSSFTA